MAQRGTGYVRRSGATEAIVADAVMRSMEDDDAAPRPVALDLAPLIAPYRKHGRLSLRVERLPPRARLTRGHNNGDRSWSLMSDELDGLAYLPPSGAAELCTLGIRIVSLDGGDGGTLALIDYPLSSTGSPVAPPATAAEKPFAAKRVVVEPQDDGELRRLRAELANAKASLAEREAELAAAKRAAEGVKPDHAGEAARIAAAEIRGEARADARAAKALAEAQAQIERLKTRSTAESARERSDESERKRLRDEVQRLKKSLSSREEELARARETWQRESESKLANAEGAWRDREKTELADARHQWQERSERALAEAKAQFERAQTRAEGEAATRLRELEAETAARIRDLEAEIERLDDALASANGAVADRESDIADIQARLDEQSARADGLSAHEDEIRRLKGEIAKSERALTQLRTEMEQAKADWRARTDAALAETEEARRDGRAALEKARAEARAEIEKAKADWRAQSDAAMAAKLAEWKRDEAARVQSIESEAQGQAQVQLARTAKRVKELEAERDQFRAHAEALLKRGDSEDIKQLRREFSHLQAVLASRELEVAQLKLDGEHARERWTAEARISLQKAEHEWKAEAEAAEREERKAMGTRRTIRDVALVGAFSAVAVMFYLMIGDGTATDYLPGSLAGWIEPASRHTALPVAAAAKPAEVAPAVHMVTVVKSANVRSGPSKTADIVATLPKATELASLERHGNWVRVKLDGAKASDGWIYSTYVADKTGTP